MDTTTTIRVTTSRVSPLTQVYNVTGHYGDDDKVHIGGLWRSINGDVWTFENRAGERISTRQKWAAVLLLCEDRGPRYFSGAVRYWYGAHSTTSA